METGAMKLYELGTLNIYYDGGDKPAKKVAIRRLYADYFIRRFDGGNNASLEFYRNLTDGSSYLYAAYTLYNGYVEEIEKD
jgi:hypothetical protein